MATASVVRPAQPPHRVALLDRVFYSSMAIAMGLTVLIGFASTYYVPLLSGRPIVTLSGGAAGSLVHLHGVLFTSWMVLFVIQTTLVASHRVAIHRRLGTAGVALAAAMVAVGTATAISTAARGSAPAGIDPLAFLAIPLFDMILFATFVTAAVVKRRNRETHKRLMLLAYVSIVVAAVARLPGVLPLGPLAFFGIAFLFVVVASAYDYASRRRVHPVYVWGGLLIAVSVPARLAISSTGPWRALAELLTQTR